VFVPGDALAPSAPSAPSAAVVVRVAIAFALSRAHRVAVAVVVVVARGFVARGATRTRVVARVASIGGRSRARVWRTTRGDDAKRRSEMGEGNRRDLYPDGRARAEAERRLIHLEHAG
jgi:hypothetical protein